MPSAIRKDHELSGEGLVTILMERQGADERTLEAFLLQRFPDNEARACVSGSVPLPSFRGIPHAALIGVDGRLLWDGSPLGESQKVEDLIGRELAKVRKGFGDSPEVQKARSLLYGRGDLSGARSIAASMPEGPERERIEAEIRRSFEWRKNAVEHFRKEGLWTRAQQVAAELRRAAAGSQDWDPEIQAIASSFETDEARAQIAASKRLERVEKMIRARKKDLAARALKGFVKSAEGTAAGARASRLLAALAVSVR
ncbi:MAG: hypothetical protein Fur0037_20860 [Planctomycetota bacterium]